jgi:hypothetical protein
MELAPNAVAPVAGAAGTASAALPTPPTVITDPTQFRVVDTQGNPLPPDKVGVPGRSSLSRTDIANPDYQNNLDRLHGLANTILDTTGSFTDDEKLDAFDRWHSMAVTGKFVGFGPDEEKLHNAIARSKTSVDIESARMAYGNAVMAAIQQADAAGTSRKEAVGRAALKTFDGMSAYDQKALFTNINAMNRTGARPYGNMADFRRQLESWAGLFAPLDRGDRLDLSADAKAALGGPNAKAAPTTSKPYAPGALSSTTA